MCTSGIPDHVMQRGTDRQRAFFLNSDREMYLRLMSRNLAGARGARAGVRAHVETWECGNLGTDEQFTLASESDSLGSKFKAIAESLALTRWGSPG